MAFTWMKNWGSDSLVSQVADFIEVKLLPVQVAFYIISNRSASIKLVFCTEEKNFFIVMYDFLIIWSFHIQMALFLITQGMCYSLTNPVGFALTDIYYFYCLYYVYRHSFNHWLLLLLSLILKITLCYQLLCWKEPWAVFFIILFCCKTLLVWEACM